MGEHYYGYERVHLPLSQVADRKCSGSYKIVLQHTLVNGRTEDSNSHVLRTRWDLVGHNGET